MTVWLDEVVIAGWHTVSGSGTVYTDEAILLCLTLRSLFRLPLRQTAGFVRSVFDPGGIRTCKVPDYTTLSRRSRNLSVPLPRRHQYDEPIHVVMDSTGIKVYGEGEWKVRTHGIGKRRTWRKLHLSVDGDTGDILSFVLTGNDGGDGEELPGLPDDIPENIEIAQVSADGGYDYFSCHDAIANRGAKASIPPRRGAKIKYHGNCHGPPHPRDEAIRSIRKHGRAKWKRMSAYHRRSLSETAMFRYKNAFTDKFMARNFENQKTETALKIRILNVWTMAGMPITLPA